MSNVLWPPEFIHHFVHSASQRSKGVHNKPPVSRAHARQIKDLDLARNFERSHKISQQPSVPFLSLLRSKWEPFDGPRRPRHIPTISNTSIFPELSWSNLRKASPLKSEAVRKSPKVVFQREAYRKRCAKDACL